MDNEYESASRVCAGCCPNQAPVVGMAYVPWQHLQTVYETENGFVRGTLFPELDKPFLAGGGRCHG